MMILNIVDAADRRELEPPRRIDDYHAFNTRRLDDTGKRRRTYWYLRPSNDTSNHWARNSNWALITEKAM